MVALGPQGRVEAAAGFADLATGELLTVEHRFRIGSVTKIFVASLVLQLVAEDLLDLDGEAAPFVEGVTIRQLLNHTSGLDDFNVDMVSFFEPYRRDPAHRWELGPRDELQLVLEKPRLFPPGKGWAYHGSNYIVLRLVVEAATGMGLRDALHERVFGPLGLQQTDLVEGPLRSAARMATWRRTTRSCPAGRARSMSPRSTFPFHRAGGGIVSTAGESPRCFAPCSAASSFPPPPRGDASSRRLRLAGDRPLRARHRRDHGADGPPAIAVRSAWGHIGFSVGYTAVALSSEDGKRQVVICANGRPAGRREAEDSFWDAAGRLAWHLYCLLTPPRPFA